jgi:hypothetical protein
MPIQRSHCLSRALALLEHAQPCFQLASPQESDDGDDGRRDEQESGRKGGEDEQRVHGDSGPRA